MIKIGVARPDAKLTEAFCDSAEGWGFYNGELRHNSNSSGKKYGESLKPGNVLGVMLDMINGELSYTINKKTFGVAYKNAALKTGKLVAACAPIYLSDMFHLNMLLRED